MTEFEIIKLKMLEYEDIFGGEFPKDRVINAKNKDELYDVFYEHSIFLEECERDAQSHLENFKNSLNLSKWNL